MLLGGDINHHPYSYLHCDSSGCLSCSSKRELISDIDIQPPEERNRQDQKVPKRSISDHIWTNSSIHNMDNSMKNSNGGITSQSLSNNPIIANDNSEFVNHGLLLWIQTREHWIANKHSKNHTDDFCEPRLSWNATYDSVLGSNKKFKQPVPLAEMVDFLADIWMQEGMYD